MKPIRYLVVLTALAAPAAAQSPEQNVLATVQRLFDAMRQRDTTAMRATMDASARLVATGANQQGQPVARTMAIQNWLRGIAGAPASPDERLYEPEVRIDQNLATVWTRYDFFVGDTFSHCGYDSFQLIQIAGQWKIIQVADTQRRSPDQCGRGSTAPAAPQPSAADTAAVIAAVQRLFDGMRTRDTVALADAFIPEAALIAVQAEAVRPSPARGWISQIAGITGGELRERMLNPEVRISDNLATVWTWYDFHRGDQFSHCGIDAAQLVRTTGGWKIAQITYTVRRSPCEPAWKTLT